MPVGLTDGFEHYIAASEKQISEVVRSGMVVVDTNVLLDAYRFAPEARAELFGALEALADRLWVPHQVALEFHKNRAKVIADHDAAYLEATSAIREFRERCDVDLGGKVKALAKRVALQDSESDRIIQAVTDGLDAAAKRLNELRERHGIAADGIRNDSVLTELQRILDGKVGDLPAEEQEEEDRAEASRRINESVPPGYQDRHKDDPHGDYLLWRQALEEAKSRKLPLLLVTRDVKDDWFWRVSGRTIGARPELIREALEVAGVHFSIMTTQGFLHHSVRELHTSVSADTLRQAEALPLPGGENITILDRKTSSPKRMPVTPHLLEFAARKATDIIRSNEKELEQIKVRRDANREAISRGDALDADPKILREADELLGREMKRIEEFIKTSNEFVEWSANKAQNAGESSSVSEMNQSLLKVYAGMYLEEQQN